MFKKTPEVIPQLLSSNASVDNNLLSIFAKLSKSLNSSYPKSYDSQDHLDNYEENDG